MGKRSGWGRGLLRCTQSNGANSYYATSASLSTLALCRYGYRAQIDVSNLLALLSLARLLSPFLANSLTDSLVVFVT